MSCPYDWQALAPECPVVRTDLIDGLTRRMLRGDGAVLVGGLGMGKSVLLHQVERRLRDTAGLRVVRVVLPPHGATVRHFLDQVAVRLGVPTGVLDAGGLLDALAPSGVHSLVILIDAIDTYARISGPEGPLGRALLSQLEAVRRERRGALGVAVAGGLGLYYLKDVVGSPFLSRASWFDCRPLDASEVTVLAAPLNDRQGPLSPALLDALRVTTGGNPALVSWVLEELWTRPGSDARALPRLVAQFRREHPSFLRGIWDAIRHPGVGDLPIRVLRRVRAGDGRIPRSELLAMGGGAMDPDEALRLLAAAGLIWLDGDAWDDPVHARPVASVANLPRTMEPQVDLRAQLCADLARLLARIARFSLDFFRSGSSGRELVPESVFSSVVAIGLAEAGWKVVEREPQQGPGFVDVKAAHPDHEGHAVIEVKRWGHAGYDGVHDQAMSYVIGETEAVAVVMAADLQAADWPERYAQRCVSGHPSAAQPCPDGLAGWLRVGQVDHFLMRLARRG